MSELNMVLVNNLAIAVKGALDATKIELNEENVVAVAAAVSQYSQTPVSLDQLFDALLAIAEEIVKKTESTDDDKVIELLQEVRDAQKNPDLGFGEKIGILLRVLGDVAKIIKKDRHA